MIEKLNYSYPYFYHTSITFIVYKYRDNSRMVMADFVISKGVVRRSNYCYV